MTQRETKLLVTLFWICAIAFFTVFSSLTYERIEKAKNSISKYRTAIETLPDETIDRDSLLLDIASLTEKNAMSTSNDYLPSIEMATTVKKKLSGYGVSIERLQTVNSGKGESIDFLLSAEPAHFFAFLRSLPTPGHLYRYAYIFIKPGTVAGRIVISMRLIHE